MKRLGLQALVGVLIGPASACGSGVGVRHYSAQGTYRCLRQRPEYKEHPSLSPTRLEFQLLAPRRIHKHAPFSNITTGPGWDFAVLFVAKNVNLWFFDKARDARAFYTAEVKGWTKKPLTLDQNVFINWGNALNPPPKPVRSIVLGCLRTR